jgi:hypothetical protein
MANRWGEGGEGARLACSPQRTLCPESSVKTRRSGNAQGTYFRKLETVQWSAMAHAKSFNVGQPILNARPGGSVRLWTDGTCEYVLAPEACAHMPRDEEALDDAELPGALFRRVERVLSDRGENTVFAVSRATYALPSGHRVKVCEHAHDLACHPFLFTSVHRCARTASPSR